MNKLLTLLVFLLSFAALCSTVSIDKAFDINDVENKACQNNCTTENVRRTSVKETYKELLTCNDCSQLFKLCVEYRTCKDSCVPAMPVLPYERSREMTPQGQPPINPCLELVTACNYESIDSYEILRSENPFLFG